MRREDVLSAHYDVNPEQIRDYRKNGHISLSQVVPADIVSHYRGIISDVVEHEHNRGTDWQEKDEHGKKESLTVMDVRYRNREVYGFVTAIRYAKIAADLMGVSKVRILGDFAVYKQPKDKNTRWHQDNNHIVIDTDNTITMWMPLTDVDESMGTMTFISGSQHLTDRIKGDGANLRAALRQKLPIVFTGPMKLGDVTFHAGTTLHMAGENTTDITREVLTIMYFEDGARFVDPDEMPSFAKSKHRVYSMAGYRPRDLAAGQEFPLVYDASVAFDGGGSR